MTTIVEELKKVSISERIQIVEDLQGSVAEDAKKQLKISADDLEEIERRYAEHIQDPSTAIPWGEVRAKLFGMK